MSAQQHSEASPPSADNPARASGALSAAVLVRTVRAELLRARSGWSAFGMLLVSVIAPLVILQSTPILESIADLGRADALKAVLSPGVAVLAGSVLFGSYAVTRDVYYGSLDRARLAARRREVFVSKVIAGAIGGLSLGILGVGYWLCVASVVLGGVGRSLGSGPEVASYAAGTVVASALVGGLGASVGWIVRNYYATAALVLMVPAAVSFVSLGSLVDIERFLPLGVSAGSGGAAIDGLLPQSLALSMLALWTAVSAIAAWVVERRRSLR